MATSGVLTGRMTGGDIVRMAHDLLGVSDAATDLTAEQGALGQRALNWMIKSWPSDATQIWRSRAFTMTWQPDTPEAALSPLISDIIDLREIDPDGSEREITRYTQAQYDVLPNNLTEGSPTIYKVGRTTGATTLAMWPVSTAALDLVGRAVTIAEDFTSLEQDVDVPQEWLETVAYQLASRLTDYYGKTGDRAARVIARAEDMMENKLAEGRPHVMRIGIRGRCWR